MPQTTVSLYKLFISSYYKTAIQRLLNTAFEDVALYLFINLCFLDVHIRIIHPPFGKELLNSTITLCAEPELKQYFSQTHGQVAEFQIWVNKVKNCMAYYSNELHVELKQMCQRFPERAKMLFLGLQRINNIANEESWFYYWVDVSYSWQTWDKTQTDLSPVITLSWC